jgi:hypothetical protein
VQSILGVSPLPLTVVAYDVWVFRSLPMQPSVHKPRTEVSWPLQRRQIFATVETILGIDPLPLTVVVQSVWILWSCSVSFAVHPPFTVVPWPYYSRQVIGAV